MKRPVVTHITVDGATARIHGDKPLTPEGKAAMRELIRAVVMDARAGKFDGKKSE